jgi:hypothetical protein
MFFTIGDSILLKLIVNYICILALIRRGINIIEQTLIAMNTKGNLFLATGYNAC